MCVLYVSAAITGVGSGHEPPLLYKMPPTVQRLTQPLAAKSKLYLLAVGTVCTNRDRRKADIWRLNQLL